VHVLPIARLRGPEQWQVLERDLRAVLSNEAQPSGVTKYGQNSLSNVLFRARMGAGIVSVRIVLVGEKAPRFVTANPEG
jgi:hypothetical protein